MDSTGVFRVNPDEKTLEMVAESDLAAHGFKERYDLQEWVAAHPHILGEPLMIVGKECSSFDGTNERADLVALDELGNVVIIELKRDDSGADVHWQAIKYASYFSRAKTDDIVKLHQSYAGLGSPEEAAQDIRSFLGVDEPMTLNVDQRIILVSHRFAREVTSAVLWLRDKHEVDIKCVQLTPLRDDVTGSLYLQSRTIIPVPGTEGFEIGLGTPGGGGTARQRYTGSGDEVSVFMASVVARACEMVPESLRPDRRSRWAGIWYQDRYYKTWHSRDPWSNHEFSYETHLFPRDGGEREYSIKFEINPYAARNNGLSGGQVEAILAAMHEYANGHDLAVHRDSPDDKSDVRVEYRLPAPKLDDSLREAAAAKLADLMVYFTPAVDDIIKDSNQEVG